MEMFGKKLAILLLAACFACGAWAVEERGNFSELTLKISTGKVELLPLEPMEIVITLANETDKEIVGHEWISPVDGFLDIYVAKDAGTFERFTPAGCWPLSFKIVRDVVLEHWFKKSIRGWIYYEDAQNSDKEKGRYLFETSGVYRLRAELWNRTRDKAVRSNIVTVKVVEPKGEDADAYRFLKGLREAREKRAYERMFLMQTASVVLGKQKELMEIFPKSGYAKYSEYSLGLAYSRQDGELFARGIDLLEKAAGHKDFFLARDALEALHGIFTRCEEPERAEKYAAMLAERFPDSPKGKDYRERHPKAEKETEMQAKDKEDGRGWSLAIIVGIGTAVLVGGICVLKLRK